MGPLESWQLSAKGSLNSAPGLKAEGSAFAVFLFPANVFQHVCRLLRLFVCLFVFEQHVQVQVWRGRPGPTAGVLEPQALTKVEQQLSSAEVPVAHVR